MRLTEPKNPSTWALPQTPCSGGTYYFLEKEKQAQEEKDFSTPSTLERRTPVFALGCRTRW